MPAVPHASTAARFDAAATSPGVVRIGPALLALAAFAGAVNRVQTARPDRHRSSSHVKS